MPSLGYAAKYSSLNKIVCSSTWIIKIKNVIISWDGEMVSWWDIHDC